MPFGTPPSSECCPPVCDSPALQSFVSSEISRAHHITFIPKEETFYVIDSISRFIKNSAHDDKKPDIFSISTAITPTKSRADVCSVILRYVVVWLKTFNIYSDHKLQCYKHMLSKSLLFFLDHFISQVKKL